METNQFILALSKTLPESCLQGLAAYLILQLLFYIDKRSTPLLKFHLFFVANLCLFVGFVLTFFHHYQQIQVAAFDPNLWPNKIGNNIPTVSAKPNLWLQFSFWTSHYAYLITGSYLLGLLFCMLKLTIGIININWFRNNRNLKLDDYLTRISIQLSSNFRLIKTVSVYLSDQICVPLTLGFIKPIIVFPIALINQLSAEQTEAILLHELAHIKRNDYLLNMLLCIVQSFLFFNPATWLMEREINKYREQSCDDLVLDNTQHKIAYARALLLIEESRNTQLALTLASNGKKYTLLNRIKRITQMKTNEPSAQNKLVVLLLAFIVICISVAWNMPVKKALKSRVLRHVKITETKSNGITSVINAEKMEVQKFSKQNQFKLYTNKINFQPNNKSKTNFTFSGNRIAFVPEADTVIQSKNKFKIVLEDSVGNKKEYNSIEELPADAQKEFLKENKKAAYVKKWDNFQLINDDNFQLINDTNKYAFNNLDWKKQAEAMRKQAEDMRKQSNSPELKKLMEDMRKQSNSPELKKLMEDMRKQSNSPELKKLMEDIKIQGEEMRKQMNSPEWKKQMEDIKIQGEDIKKQFNSPEWKKQMESLRVQSAKIGKQSEAMRKYYQSPEWKKQQKKMQIEIEKSQKEWKKSYDVQPKPVMPMKQLEPQE